MSLEKKKNKKTKLLAPPFKKKWSVNPLFLAIIIILALLAGGTGGYFYQKNNSPQEVAVLGEEDSSYLAFTGEIYDKIKENYWKKLADEDLTSLYLLAAEKLTSQPQNPKEKNRQALLANLKNILKQIEDEETKEDFIVQLNNLVLNNLEPFGRSHLYSQKEEQELNNMVRNITDQDHYRTLGIDQEANQKEIEKAYQNLNQELSGQDDPETQEKLAQVKKAYEVLKDDEARQIYDLSGVEPTMSYQLINNSIFHIHLKKFSPTTFDELQRVSQKVQGQAGVD
ncbi:MAG: Carboxyl-terminal protease, partial [Microgenomates bacterium 39_6]